MNKQKTVAETIPYEAPCMTTVPIRTSGMLCVSGGMDNHIPVNGIGSFDSPFGANPGNIASEDNMTDLNNTSGWGSDF